ncbi:OR10V1: Olfactory receptor [Crotalus adamanteus]|uniref:OR10V1: Olfactory receptor n=1 Tax=Crotalus adamanteus TaxID=8729 RepID=A0AAW1C783_CROAD
MQITILILRLPFCGNHETNHFLWGYSCPSGYILHHLSIILASPFVLVSTSYTFIVRAILKISTTSGWQRAFSTCSSHLMVVIMQYSCSGLIYLQPGSSYSAEEGQVVSIFYTFDTPVLNPLIYTM